MLEENATIKGKLDKEQVSRLSQTLLLDLIVNTVQSGSSESPSEETKAEEKKEGEKT